MQVYFPNHYIKPSQIGSVHFPLLWCNEFTLLPFLSKKESRKLHIGSGWPFTWGRNFGWKRFSIDVDSLTTHLYVVGRSGKGKSKFLEGFLWQLIRHGCGCGLIDPHGDLADNLIKLLTKEPIDKLNHTWIEEGDNASRLVYVEPGRHDYFTPMNVLTDNYDSYTVATNVIEAFQRTWNEELKTAPQFKNTALHGLLLLIEHGLSLVELPTLFMQKEYRDSLLEGSANEDVKMFFEFRFGQWKNEQALRVESLLNKVTALTLNPSLRQMLGADHNGLNLRSIMDEDKILIVNLGKCDHETRNLLGSLLVVNLEQAALSRANIPEEQRNRWFCVLDEFQRFIANAGSALAVAEMLSEARKFGLILGLSHQGWHQLESSRLEGALDQAQIKIIFGSGSQTGRVIADELFVLDPLKVKDESSGGSKYFESLMEQKEMFVQSIRRQGHREIFVLPPDSDKVIGLRTLDVPSPKVEQEELERIKTHILKQKGLKVETSRTIYLNSQSVDRYPALGRIL